MPLETRVSGAYVGPALIALAVTLGACGGDSDRHSAEPRPEPPAEPPPEPSFEKLTLHQDFYCEGAAFGDFDQDGVTDVAAGPDWYSGPSYDERHPVWQRPAQPFDVKSYSDCFFQFARDFDGDGWLDLLVVGFPGAAAYWYENSGDPSLTWTRHPVRPIVDGESPELTDVTGDGVPELVMMQGGALGWAAPDPGDPYAEWTFHPATEVRGYFAFTHGLGAGDLDGDGRKDLLEATGYFLQPPSLAGDPRWTRGEQAFGSGGAQMIVSDVDGDGDADVVSTLAAHGYGFAWYERNAGAFSFTEHVVVPNSDPPPEAGVVLHEPHALAMGDIDGDGVTDVVTGERFWAHVPAGDPSFADPGRLYWFRRELGPNGPTFTPKLIDDQSGVGTQVTVGDGDGDGDLDIAVTNKKGAFVFRQRD